MAFIPDDPNHPFTQFKPPEELNKDVEKVSEFAKFWRTHWLAFYLTLGFTLLRAYQNARVNRALFKLTKYVEKSDKIQKANPKRKRR